MHPLKILIADDEAAARELLLHYLQAWPGMETKECADGRSTLRALEEFRPHILFLDIKMPEMTGLEVMQRKAGAMLPAVVFTTAYDGYALPAFDYEVVDYLLKPFEKERFDKALKRAVDYVGYANSRQPRSYLSQLPVKMGSKIDLVNIDAVYYFQAEGAYIQAITDGKVYLITGSVYELESSLDPAKFIRIHRSVIVRKDAVKSIRSLPTGDHILILENGEAVRASRTYREKINALKGK